MATYNDKRDDSFKTKYKLFLFSKVFTKDFTLENFIKDNDIVSEFEKFTVTQKIADIYSSQYYQKKETEYIKYNDKEIQSKNIWLEMNIHTDYNMFNLISNKKRKNVDKKYQNFYLKLKENHNNTFKKTFLKKDFDIMINNKECSYCGISDENIKKLGRNGKLHNKRSETRGYTLEVDRMSPNLEYTADNCCMSCYWCNNAKTDEYLPSEFKEIARGINIVWNQRLKKAGIDEKVIFPEESLIWTTEPK